MGKRIDEETIRRINEVYAEVGVKSKTAQIVGVSPSTVSKYLIPGFKTEVKEEVHYEFDKIVPGCKGFLEKIAAPAQVGDRIRLFCELCMMSKDEWNEMEEMQKEILI